MLSDMAVGRFPGTPPLPYTLVTLQEINHLALDLVHFLRPRPPTPSEQRPLAGDPESCRKPTPRHDAGLSCFLLSIINAVSRAGLWISSLFVCLERGKRGGVRRKANHRDHRDTEHRDNSWNPGQDHAARSMGWVKKGRLVVPHFELHSGLRQNVCCGFRQ
jgi:hypothetical protein